MKHALFRGFLACFIVLAFTARVSANDARFSQTLSAEEKTAAGLTQLSSDEVAVIDALVRRDTGTRERAVATETTAAMFSQRLTADERRTAGLTKLTGPEQLAKLDGFVERHQNAKLARSLLSPPTFVSRPASRVTPTERKKEREIHGSFSLSYGMGSGGYSEKSGSMVLTLEDPARNFTLSVGYTETHVKGGYIYRDPFYDPLRGDGLRGGIIDSSAPIRP